MNRFALLLSGVVVVVLLWVAGWMVAAGYLKSAITDLPEAGIDLTCADVSVAGFPFRFDLTCREAVFVSEDLRLSLPEVRASALVYRPTHVQMFALGPLSMSDAFTGSRQEMNWESLAASLRLNGWRLARLSADADGLTLTDTLAGSTPLAAALGAEVHLVDAGSEQGEAAEMTARALLRLSDATLPGIESGNAELEADITSLPDDIRRWGEPEILRLWQEAGGRLVLNRLSGSAVDMSIEASGEAGLTRAGEIEGRFSVVSNGLVEQLNLDPDTPAILRSLVTGTAVGNGSYRQNLTINKGVVFMGLFPLMELMPLF